jgi:alpha-galactosidase
MSAAPLWIGIDIPSMTEEARSILLNRDAIAIDQDPLGMMATQRQINAGSAPGECWVRPLMPTTSGKWRAAAILFNADDKASAVISVSANALGVPPLAAGTIRVREIWSNTTSQLDGVFTSKELAPHDSIVILLEEQ